MLNFSDKYSAYRMVNTVLDALIAFLSFHASVVFRSYVDTGTFVLSPVYHDFIWISFLAFFLWPFLLHFNGLYPVNRLRNSRKVVFIITRAGIQGVLMILFVIFVLKLHIVSRSILIGGAALASLILLVKEKLIIRYLCSTRTAGKMLRSVLVVGETEAAYEIIRVLKKNQFLGLVVAGILVPQKGEPHSKIPEVSVMGAYEDIEEVLRLNPIDNVIIATGKSDLERTERVIACCEEQGVEIWIAANIFNITISKLDAGDLLGIPMFILRTVPKFSWQLFCKSILDVIGAFVLSFLTFPIVAVAAVLIKATSDGPLLFKQVRCGLHGRKFVLYKLRTMYKEADKMLEGLKKDNIISGPAFKIDKDPRITPVGRFLRKMSIDELPQLWNVLKGDMSMVGPRPPIPEEVEKYRGWQRRRLSMRPGITGLWQVSGRSKITQFDKWVELDLEYVDNWSLSLDCSIIARTIWVVLSGTGK